MDKCKSASLYYGKVDKCKSTSLNNSWVDIGHLQIVYFFKLWLDSQVQIYFFMLWLGGQMQIYFFKQYMGGHWTITNCIKLYSMAR